MACPFAGVEDDGYPRGLEPSELQSSLDVLASMAQCLRAAAAVVRCPLALYMSG